MTLARPAAGLLALVLLTAGCSHDEAAAPAPVPTPVVTQAVTPTEPLPDAGVSVVLAPDGIGFASGSRISRLDFGTPAGTVRQALTQSLQEPGTTSALPDCGQGPRTSVQFDGFSILLQGTAFVGWTERGSAERDLTTADGIGLQTTLQELRAAVTGVTVTNDSLGPEFASESGLSGLLDGTTPQSRITLISGGETCVFR